MHIFLEGCDLSGKSTTFKSLWEKMQKYNNFNLFLSDRSLLSILCYGEFYNRYNDNQLNDLYNNVLQFLFNDNIIFYIKNTEEEIRNRYSDRGDERDIEDIIGVKAVYDKYSEKLKHHFNFYEIDSNGLNTEQISQIILQKYNDIISSNIETKINKYNDIIDNYGVIVKNTKEVVNINIKHDETIENFNKNYKNYSDFSNYENFKNIIDEKFIELEIYSYAFQLNKFFKKVSDVMSNYNSKNEDIFSRKFIFTDDECLSFLHVMYRDNIVYVNINFRSSNIKLLNIDIMSIYYMVNFFIKKINTTVNIIKFNINISSLHKYLNGDK